jgi:hypothetical protein
MHSMVVFYPRRCNLGKYSSCFGHLRFRPCFFTQNFRYNLHPTSLKWTESSCAYTEKSSYHAQGKIQILNAWACLPHCGCVIAAVCWNTNLLHVSHLFIAYGLHIVSALVTFIQSNMRIHLQHLWSIHHGRNVVQILFKKRKKQYLTLLSTVPCKRTMCKGWKIFKSQFIAGQK